MRKFGCIVSVRSAFQRGFTHLIPRVEIKRRLDWAHCHCSQTLFTFLCNLSLTLRALAQISLYCIINKYYMTL